MPVAPRLCLVLGAIVMVLACGGGDKVPEPWVEHEGREEVVGNPDRASGAAPSTPRAGDESAEPTPPGLLPPNTRVERPDVEDGLPEVADSYEDLAQAGTIEHCPGDLVRTDKKEAKGQLYCATAAGVRHGPWLSFHRGGATVKEVGPYVAGQRHGVFVGWDTKGAVERRMRWADGQPVGEVRE